MLTQIIFVSVVMSVLQRLDCCDTEAELEEDLRPVAQVFCPGGALKILRYDDRIARHQTRAIEGR